MNERLIVKGFAGISEVELDIGRMNMLIGPQAAGKSICAKMLFYFKNFLSEMHASVQNEESKWDFDRNLIAKFEKYFPKSSWPDGAFSIRYEIGDTFILIERASTKTPKVHISYSDYFSHKFRECRTYFRREQAKESDEDFERLDAAYSTQKRLLLAVHEHIGVIAGFNQIFIPAGRSFFANLQSSIFSFLSSNEALDPFLVEFGSFYERIKNYPSHGMRRRDKQLNAIASHASELVYQILHGKHERVKGKDAIMLEDGRLVNLENASSGQQEMLPLAIMLSFLPFSRFMGGGTTVYIEEPEAHLFPTAQRHIVELIATAYNARPDALQFVITTHSPYILTAFNNLIQAGMLAQGLPEEKREQLDSIVPALHRLSPGVMRAYAIKEGSQYDLTCRETGLISAAIIDEVSDALSVQFGNLLEVE